MTTDAGRASDSAPTLSGVFAESDARWQRHVELLADHDVLDVTVQEARIEDTIKRMVGGG